MNRIRNLNRRKGFGFAVLALLASALVTGAPASAQQQAQKMSSYYPKWTWASDCGSNVVVTRISRKLTAEQ